MKKKKAVDYSIGFSARFWLLLGSRQYTKTGRDNYTYQDLSYRELGDLFGSVTKRAIHKWVKGDNLPSIHNLNIISDDLNVSLDFLVKGIGNLNDKGPHENTEETLILLMKGLSKDQKMELLNSALKLNLEPVDANTKTKKQTELALIPTVKDLE